MEQYLNKIIHGDCLEVMKKMPDKCVDLVLTDPPYGVEWQSNRRSELHRKIENDDNTNWILPIFTEVFRVMKDDSICVSFYGWPEIDIFLSTWKKIGFIPKSHFVWKKNNIGIGWFTRGQHESAFLLAKGNPKKPKVAISDVLDWTGTGNELHPTQKPVGALEPIIETYSETGGVVLDPFGGSCTTAVACMNLKRNYICIEKEQQYVNICNARIAAQTKQLF